MGRGTIKNEREKNSDCASLVDSWKRVSMQTLFPFVPLISKIKFLSFVHPSYENPTTVVVKLGVRIGVVYRSILSSFEKKKKKSIFKII